MTDRKDVKIRRKPRPKYDSQNKETANKKEGKKHWKKRPKKPEKDLGISLQELQAYINSEYHAP